MELLVEKGGVRPIVPLHKKSILYVKSQFCTYENGCAKLTLAGFAPKVSFDPKVGSLTLKSGFLPTLGATLPWP